MSYGISNNRRQFMAHRNNWNHFPSYIFKLYTKQKNNLDYKRKDEFMKDEFMEFMTEEELAANQPSQHKIQKITVQTVLIMALEKIYASSNAYAKICSSYNKDIKGYREGVDVSDIKKVIGGIIYYLDKDNEIIKDNYGIKS